jgi:hypothetical protein
MKIQINSDKSIPSTAADAASFRGDIERLLARYASEITRVEAHLSDVNGPRQGQLDKRCALEVRLKGKNPISATHSAKRIDSAVRGAAQKMQRLLETTYGKKAAVAKVETAGKRTAASKASIAKAHRIETLLAQLLEEAPQAGTQVKKASDAIDKVLKMIEPAAPAGKTAAPTGMASPKKKKTPIYQMRRKAPRRVG